MRRPNRSLAYGLLALLGLSLLALPWLTRSGQAANPITLQQPAPVVQPGDVLTLTGKQRFNDGQFRNQLFYVGPEQVQAQRIDAGAVSLTVPELAPGVYAVRVVKQAGGSPPQTLFSQDVEVGGGDQVIAAASGVVSPGGGRVELPGVARIELTEDITRPSTNFTVEHVSSPIYRQFFLEYMSSGVSMAGVNLPQVAAENFIRVRADQPVAGDMGLKLRVPQEVLDALTPNLEPEIYAEFVNVGADDEEFVEMEALRAEFNAETGEVTAPLPAHYFRPAEDAAPAVAAAPAFEGATLAASAAAGLEVEAIIRVAVRAYNAERNLTVKGTITVPSTETFEATARETVNLAGKFNTVVPRVLVNPTIYNPFVVTSGFSGRHSGVDLRTRDTEAVSSCADGVVTAAQFDPYRRLPNGQLRRNRFGQPQSGGFYVAIRHDDGTSTAYLHLINNSNVVNVQARVTPGQQIARGDSTGGVTAAHLHLNYRVDGAKVNAVPYLRVGEPADYFRQLNIVATVNGTPVAATRRQITQSRDFEYAAPLDLSLLDLQPNDRSYHVVGTYPVPPEPGPTPGATPVQNFGALSLEPQPRSMLRVPLTYVTADLVEYTLPGQPGVKLYLHRAPKGAPGTAK